MHLKTPGGAVDRLPPSLAALFGFKPKAEAPESAPEAETTAPAVLTGPVDPGSPVQDKTAAAAPEPEPAPVETAKATDDGDEDDAKTAKGKAKAKKKAADPDEDGDDEDDDEDNDGMKARATGRAEERQRIQAIFAHAGAAKNPALAQKLAFSTDLTAAQAGELLDAGGSTGGLAARMANAVPVVGPDAATPAKPAAGDHKAAANYILKAAGLQPSN